MGLIHNGVRGHSLRWVHRKGGRCRTTFGFAPARGQATANWSACRLTMDIPSMPVSGEPSLGKSGGLHRSRHGKNTPAAARAQVELAALFRPRPSPHRD